MENLQLREMFVNEHRQNNGKINSLELKTWALFSLGKMFSYQIGNNYLIEELKKKLEKNKKLNQEDIGYFLDCVDLMKKKIDDKLGNQIKIIEEIISYDIGNKEILTRMKEKLSNNIELNNQDFRYHQFCLNELERQKIFENGIVPPGWLSSDSTEVKEMREQIEKTRKYTKWGILAAGDDILKKGKIDL